MHDDYIHHDFAEQDQGPDYDPEVLKIVQSKVDEARAIFESQDLAEIDRKFEEKINPSKLAPKKKK